MKNKGLLEFRVTHDKIFMYITYWIKIKTE